jgi:hypothetical protein
MYTPASDGTKPCQVQGARHGAERQCLDGRLRRGGQVCSPSGMGDDRRPNQNNKRICCEAPSIGGIYAAAKGTGGDGPREILATISAPLPSAPLADVERHCWHRSCKPAAAETRPDRTRKDTASATAATTRCLDRRWPSVRFRACKRRKAAVTKGSDRWSI